MLLTFEVLVGFTDRTISNGAFVTQHRLVTISANTDDEATCVAAQLIDCVTPKDSIIISSNVTEVVA